MAKRQALSQDDLFAGKTSAPKGFAYQEALISAEQEALLLQRFRDLPFKAFDFHGFLGKRRVVSFGWRYDFSERTVRASEPIPEFLLPVREQAAAFANLKAESLKQVLINEYAAGAGIGWHRDKAMFDEVIAVSIGSPCILRLRLKSGKGWERFSQVVTERSAYLLRHQARREWEHSVPPVAALRYSITFRNFVESRDPA